jgi:ArsR family transcriptional regulator
MQTFWRQAALLKAMGHPVRLQIVDLLRAEPECVCHISAALNKPQPYVSQQLAILRNANVIVDERDGTNIFYRLADANVAQLVAAACGDALAPRERQVINCCNCPKCSIARGGGVEALRVAC